MTDLVERLRLWAAADLIDGDVLVEAADALEEANERNRKLHRRCQEEEALRFSIVSYVEPWIAIYARSERSDRWVLRLVSRTVRNRDEFKKAVADFEARHSANPLEAAQAQAAEVRRETIAECARIAEDEEGDLSTCGMHRNSVASQQMGYRVAAAIRALTDAANEERT